MIPDLRNICFRSLTQDLHHLHMYLTKNLSQVHNSKLVLTQQYLPRSMSHKKIRSIFFPLPYEDGSRDVIGEIL